ncbi:bifunctional diguanylate cyclase/phosphodiesterase [Caulobacter sp. UNC358MFTsu5.1]|uniref:putative bifunctional diguanylate cyclase/phosphodiesterase n=1 Tax=Caulobacter sp. UNC358MFTsu5.1 TaxID=1449049 RepID=UPI000555B381|nr:EAL domain-containing protein [Caulobacter sp. UNC358MFTsu5.1]
MFRRLQTKLTVLYAGLFALALSLVAVSVYLTIANNAQQQVRRELTATGTVFDSVWALRTQRLRDGADLLARDFGFRAAVATRDAPTVESAVTNLRQRMGLDLAFLVGVDGDVVGVDPAKVDIDKLWSALDHEERAQGVFIVDGAPYQLISAPVMSPNLTGWIVFGARLDDREMTALERLSAIRLDAQVFDRRGETWVTTDKTADTGALGAVVATAMRQATAEPARLRTATGDSLVLVKRLMTLDGQTPAALVLRYPMALALAPYQPLMAAVIIAGLIGAALVVAASWALSRDIARPITALEAAARRLRHGEAAHVDVRSSDEIGRLSDSFNLMAAEIREREVRITELALRDAETGLPNHLAMEREIEARMARLAPGQQVVVAALGLDRFTVLRSAIGYALFTQLVREIGARIQVLDPEAVVGRLTTSTLCVISRLTALTDEVVPVVERALVDLAAPVRLGNELVDVHMSNGLAAAEAGGLDAPRLIEQAMIALDQARACGRKVAIFDPVAYGDPAGNLSLMSEMLQGVATGALFLHHQPKLDLRTGAITGVEALVRWNHPARGLLRPDLFVGMAEETGHIRALTDCVIDRAILDQRALRDLGHDLTISINISGRLIDDAEFADRAIEKIAASGARFCFEITETAVIGNPDVALGVLAKLNAAGIPVSIDDYGSGLSSLAYLKQINADELKIDKAFVLSLENDAKDALLVKSTIDLAHSLGLKVTAEGVESREALAMLQMMGCDLAQGYHIAKPMALEALVAFLGEQRLAETSAPAKARRRAR